MLEQSLHLISQLTLTASPKGEAYKSLPPRGEGHRFAKQINMPVAYLR